MNSNSMINSQISTAGVFKDYDSADISKARVSNVILFFHASWCPIGRGAEKEIYNNPTQIPANLTILKVGYDKETSLR